MDVLTEREVDAIISAGQGAARSERHRWLAGAIIRQIVSQAIARSSDG